MKGNTACAVPAGIALFRVGLWLVRGALFLALMIAHPFVKLGSNVGFAACFVGLLLGCVIAPHQTGMLLAFVGTGVGLLVVMSFYEQLILTLAPGRFPLLPAR